MFGCWGLFVVLGGCGGGGEVGVGFDDWCV